MHAFNQAYTNIYFKCHSQVISQSRQKVRFLTSLFLFSKLEIELVKMEVRYEIIKM